MKNALKIISAFIAALLLYIPSLCAESTDNPIFKVEDVGGVPFVTENGTPIRSRMFFGMFPGERFKMVGTGWGNISYVFRAERDDHAEITTLFDPKINEVFLYDFSITDLSDGKMPINLIPDFKAEVTKKLASEETKLLSDGGKGAVHIFKTAVGLGTHPIYFSQGGIKLKKGHVYRLSYRLRYDIPGWFNSYVHCGARRIAASSEKTFAKQQKLAAQNGVNFVKCFIHTLWDENPSRGLLESIDFKIATMLKANPNAKIIARVGAEPSEKWLKLHPDSAMRNFDGKPTVRTTRGTNPVDQYFVSVSSSEYRAYASAALARTAKYLESKYGKHIAGYHIGAANTGEWFYVNPFASEFSGYDKSTLSAWRKWLKKKYTNGANLRAAWNDKNASLADAPVPSQSERTEIGNLLNPEKNQNVIDFNIFLQDEMTDTIVAFSKTVKEIAPNKLTINFYGYGYQFSGMRFGPARTGHYGIRKLLDSKYIDIVCGPVSYHDRKLGDGKSTMGASDSYAANGKIWYNEDDNRPYLMWTSGSITLDGDPNQRSQLDSIKVMRRNIAQEAIRNNSSWWLDLFGSGWYDEPELWRQVELCKEAEIDMMKNPSPYRPDVVTAYDELSMCHIGKDATNTTGRLMRDILKSLNKCGMPYGQFLFDDILSERVGAKLCIASAAFAMDKSQRKKMSKLSKKMSFIWGWLPAYIDVSEGKYSVRAVKEATGFDVREEPNALPIVHSTKQGLDLGLPKTFGSSERISPLLSPIPQDGDIVLAEFEGNIPAIILRMSDGKPQVFCAVPTIPAELIRAVAKKAGVHIYTEQPTAVFANGGYVSICAPSDGVREINLGSDLEIFDVFTNESLGKGPKISLDMKMGDIKFLRLGRGNIEKSNAKRN